jgi:hypothetical protein
VIQGASEALGRRLPPPAAAGGGTG